ncbi:DUF6252 family protein [Flavobacterium sp. NG2]|uniref:DUF6252 family protein n=1 Tax=Flavobacterium sp. NG2 TaxID=3097547 RepID=UPI002A831646|nr:DUF6252 family protein [Flavobacterium sp. NG2]WPR72534.1 DUF6252 family protein [Flavobacterium sp. NG2]
MKKYFLYSVLLFCLNSCEENVKFNNPSFQGVKDNIFWRAITTSATVNTAGVVTINAYTRDEQVTLKTNGSAVKTYELGVNNAITATYVQTNTSGNLSYATSTGKGDGQIIITEYDNINNTISGTFRFNAVNTVANSTAEPVLNFQQGVFYKVPVQP